MTYNGEKLTIWLHAVFAHGNQRTSRHVFRSGQESVPATDSTLPKSLEPIMLRTLTIALLALAVTLPVSAGTKEELALIKSQIGILQASTEDAQANTLQRIAVLEKQLDASQATQRRLEEMLNSLERILNEKTDRLIKPVTSSSLQVQTLTNEFGALRDAVDETNSRLGKLEQQVEDVMTEVTRQPSYPAYGPGGGGMDEGGADALTLFNSGKADYTTGQYDFAKIAFEDYISKYPNTLRTPEAVYYLGMIEQQQDNPEKAIEHYDSVLDEYQPGPITPDAHFKKGKALVELGRQEEAAQEFKNIVETYPNAPIAPVAQGELDRLQSGAANAGQKPSPLRRSSRLR